MAATKKTDTPAEEVKPSTEVLDEVSAFEEFQRDYAKMQASVKVVKNKVNSHFTSNYVDLAGLIDDTQEPIHNNNFVVLQTVEYFADIELILLTTKLVHKNGRSLESTYPILPKDATNPQSLGSTLTYARRYMYLLIIGAAPEDDDGNYAASVQPAPAPRKAGNGAMTTKQKNWIDSLLNDKGYTSADDQGKVIKALVGKTSKLTSADASKIIDTLKGDYPANDGSGQVAPF